MNPRLDAISPSVIRELHGRKRSTSIDLGLGEPLLRPEPGPLEEAFAWVARHGCPYSPNAGFTELRQAIAARYGHGELREASQVGVTVGAQEALTVALKALVDPAQDEVLVVTPAYPLYSKLCQLEGIRVREVSLDPSRGFAPCAATVLAQVGPCTRVVLLASPSNPTGRVWPREQLALLAEGLGAAGGQSPRYILSDEVYQELYFGDERPASPATYWPNTVVVGSLSKCCALTGLRVGWFLAPAAAAPALHKVHQLLVSCTTSLGQRAALAIFARPELLEAHRPHYVAQRVALLAAAAAAGLRVVPPDGTFFALARLPEPLAQDSTAAAFTLLDRADVVAIPGATFGAEGYLRLSFVAPPDVLAEGVRRIADLFGAPR